jgi:predicted enzyme involved in methoxymalonyl-ACP biosynthesis
MFIDDNPMNRNEALQFVPGMTVEDETVIESILTNPLFAGKRDQGLTRLKQYKLLEARNQDLQVSGDNVEFLRNSNIQVTIEHDVESHLDRAIELINRTNQL